MASKKNNQGQSLVEVVFAVGIAILVIAGVVSLIVGAVKIKTTSLQRKKASELAQTTIEQLVDKKTNDPNSFWVAMNNNNYPTPTPGGGYTVGVGFSKGDCGGTDCGQAKVSVSWGVGQSLVVNRFFSKSE